MLRSKHAAGPRGDGPWNIVNRVDHAQVLRVEDEHLVSRSAVDKDLRFAGVENNAVRSQREVWDRSALASTVMSASRTFRTTSERKNVTNAYRPSFVMAMRNGAMP